MNVSRMTPDQRIAFNVASDLFRTYRNDKAEALEELLFRKRRTLGIDWTYVEYCLQTLFVRDEMRKNRRRAV